MPAESEAEEQDTKRLSVDIPKELHTVLKMHAARVGGTVKERVVEAIEQHKATGHSGHFQVPLAQLYTQNK